MRVPSVSANPAVFFVAIHPRVNDPTRRRPLAVTEESGLRRGRRERSRFVSVDVVRCACFVGEVSKVRREGGGGFLFFFFSAREHSEDRCLREVGV